MVCALQVQSASDSSSTPASGSAAARYTVSPPLKTAKAIVPGKPKPLKLEDPLAIDPVALDSWDEDEAAQADISSSLAFNRTSTPQQPNSTSDIDPFQTSLLPADNNSRKMADVSAAYLSPQADFWARLGAPQRRPQNPFGHMTYFSGSGRKASDSDHHKESFTSVASVLPWGSYLAEERLKGPGAGPGLRGPAAQVQPNSSIPEHSKQWQ